MLSEPMAMRGFTMSMSDRELLELAAKAAGVPGEYSEWWEMGEQFYSGFRAGRTWGAWNPLTDDGDALRLAVKLYFDVCINGETVFVRDFDCNETELMLFDDPMAATRRAIVRAAARIGEAQCHT